MRQPLVLLKFTGDTPIPRKFRVIKYHALGFGLPLGPWITQAVSLSAARQGQRLRVLVAECKGRGFAADCGIGLLRRVADN